MAEAQTFEVAPSRTDLSYSQGVGMVRRPEDQLRLPSDLARQTWLDGEMAKRPYIARYFIEGAADEVLSRLVSSKRNRPHWRMECPTQ